MSSRVAIMGGGAAGLTTAWLLDPEHEITLYDKEPSFGGHAHTFQRWYPGMKLGSQTNALAA